MIASLIEQRGSVAELHALDPDAFGAIAAPQVWWCRPTDAAIVLGSRQTPDIVDPDACGRIGLDVVRRRSGGGAVVIRPDAVVWIDLVLPHGVAPDDVRGAMEWAGERWAAAIDELVGASAGSPPMSLHRGGMVTSPWSDLVCFAGIGPGEVLVEGRKLVGLSQRRTRHGLRIQGMMHGRSLSADVANVVRPTADTPPGPVPDPAVVHLDAARLAAALTAQITDETTRL